MVNLHLLHSESLFKPKHNGQWMKPLFSHVCKMVCRNRRIIQENYVINPEITVLLVCRFSICKTFYLVYFYSHTLQHENNSELLTLVPCVKRAVTAAACLPSEEGRETGNKTAAVVEDAHLQYFCTGTLRWHRRPPWKST